MLHSDIHFEQKGRAALVTLDRPNALNALSIDMVVAFADRLSRWANDDTVTHLVLCSSSPRAFCAGGDIKYARQLAISDDPAGAEPYFRAEYLADIALIEFGKPVIALCAGIVMGGGAGLALHSQHIVMTERTRFAMPESSIGLFPDVGASLFLGRCPKSVARLIGMTGHIVEASDCLLLGLANAQVPGASLVELKEKLLRCHVDEIESTIKQFEFDAGQSSLATQRQLIDHIFADGSAESMRDRAVSLAQSMPYNKLLSGIVMAFKTCCPLSMKLFNRLLVETDQLTDPVAAIELDFHLALRMIKRADFAEGIRATVIDKDQAPQWSPNSLEAVTQTMLDAVFDRSGLPSLR